MTNYDPVDRVRHFLSQDLLASARCYLSHRFVLFAIAAAAIFLAAKMNWGWLVAAGFAPILLLMAPCAVMCGLGMCRKGGKKSPTDDHAAPGNSDSVSNSSPPVLFSSSSDRSADGTVPTSKKPNQSDRKSCC